MFGKNLSGWMAGISGATGFLLAHPATATAQCIMCYLSASSSGERGSQVLRMGILVLVVPVLLTFSGVFLLAYRRRNPVGSDAESDLANQTGTESDLPLSADPPSHSPSVL